MRAGRRALASLAVVVLLAGAASASSYRPLIWDGCEDPGYRTHPGKEEVPVRVALIAPSAVHRKMKQGDLVDLVDVRNHWDFERAHLAGARNFPADTISSANLPEGRLQVLYCGECCCPEITEAAKAMLARGRRDMVILRAGLEDVGDLVLWKAENVRLEDEPDPFNELPCGPERAAIRDLTKRMKLQEIPPIEFELDSARLLPHSFETLETVADIMYDHPRIGLSVHGHTCTIGGAAYNQTLSEQRAKTVIDYLKKAGVRKSALASLGFGLSRPIADNRTEEGRALNRRVEFHWVQQDAVKVRRRRPPKSGGVKQPKRLPE